MSDRLAEIKQRLADDAYGCVPDYGAEADAGPDIEWLVKRLAEAEKDVRRMDYLEGESLTAVDTLFRRNIPITRERVDAALAPGEPKDADECPECGCVSGHYTLPPCPLWMRSVGRSPGEAKEGV